MEDIKREQYIDDRPIDVDKFSDEEIRDFLLQFYTLEELKECGLA